jgi:predicted transcriptional regulator
MKEKHVHMPAHFDLSRRERQIMDIIYRKGQATASEVYDAMVEPPSDTSVRKLIRILEEKGHLDHERKGREYVYHPTVSRTQASRAAVKHVVDTFFEGSAVKAVAALLGVSKNNLSPGDVARLSKMVDEAAGEGR